MTTKGLTRSVAVILLSGIAAVSTMGMRCQAEAQNGHWVRKYDDSGRLISKKCEAGGNECVIASVNVS